MNGEQVLAHCVADAASTALYPVDLTDLPVLSDTQTRVRTERPVVAVPIVNAGYDPRYDGLKALV